MVYNKKKKGCDKMGMGYCACFDLVVSEDSVKKICEEEYNALNKVLSKYNVSWNSFAYAIRYDDNIADVSEDEMEEILFSYRQLVKRFKANTDFTIDISYHDSSEEGDRYDEVDGCFFTINFGEFYEMTPFAKKAKQQGIEIDLKTYVSYG